MFTNYRYQTSLLCISVYDHRRWSLLLPPCDLRTKRNAMASLPPLKLASWPRILPMELNKQASPHNL